MHWKEDVARLRRKGEWSPILLAFQSIVSAFDLYPLPTSISSHFNLGMTGYTVSLEGDYLPHGQLVHANRLWQRALPVSLFTNYPLYSWLTGFTCQPPKNVLLTYFVHLVRAVVWQPVIALIHIIVKSSLSGTSLEWVHHPLVFFAFKSCQCSSDSTWENAVEMTQ